MKGIPGPPALSAPWRSLRKFDPDRKGREIVFGATKAAAACGLSPYDSPLDLYCEALGLKDEQEDNDAMRMGRRLEPLILDEYSERRGVQLVRSLPMHFHDEFYWVGATPDAIVPPSDDELVHSAACSGVVVTGHNDQEWGVDAKSSTFRRLDKEGEDPLKFGIEGTDQMPVDYVMQAQQQMAVLGLPFIEFPVLFDTRTLKIYRVARNEDLIRTLVRCEKELLDRLFNNDPPEPNWTAGNTRELIGLIHGRDPDKVYALSEIEAKQWVEIQKDKEQIKTLNDAIKERTNKLLWRMEAATVARFPGGTKQLKRIVVKPAKIEAHTREGYEYLKETKVKE